MDKVIYYRCNHCLKVGVLVSSKKWGYCGGRWCGRAMYLPKVKITREEFKRIWG